MTKKKSDAFARAAEELDLNINGLIGNLGEAVTEIINRLDDGRSGEISREHVFDTEKGPIRAQAGIRVKMGGLGEAVRTTSKPRPVNPDRKHATKPTTPASKPRAPAYDLIEDSDRWILTADMPGVVQSELVLHKEDDTLHISTTGDRVYHVKVDIGSEFDVESASVRLRNGILDLQLPKVPKP